MTEIRLPGDALVLLVGPAGSGKTTFAARWFAPEEILSSDAFRALVAGSEADQSASEEAFRRLHAALDARLARGNRTVVDATNVQDWARGQLLDAARRAGRPAAAIVLDLPVAICIERARDRSGRPVPAAVVRRQHRALRANLARLPAEGYRPLVILRDTGAVEALVVVTDRPQSSSVEESATSRT